MSKKEDGVKSQITTYSLGDSRGQVKILNAYELTEVEISLDPFVLFM